MGDSFCACGYFWFGFGNDCGNGFLGFRQLCSIIGGFGGLYAVYCFGGESVDCVLENSP